MPVIQLGPWLPDQADFQNPGVITATNVVPVASGYAPVKSLETDTNALDGRPRGALGLRAKSGTRHEYAGDAAKLYERSGRTWTDRSKSGGYSTGADERWEFVRWKEKVLATNFSDNPQQLLLGGPNFSDLTDAVQGRHIGVVRNFVVLGNTSDDVDGDVPNRVRWSAIGDETDWTVSASTLSDYQDLPAGGPVRAVMGGEFGVVICDNSVWRMTFVGSPTVFQFDEVLPNIGTIASGSVVRDGDTVYLLSERGFFAIDSGSQARSIGATRVDRFVLDDLQDGNTNRISAVADVPNRRILWAYPGADANGGTPNRIIVYDVTLDRWSLIQRNVEQLFLATGVDTTLEELDAFSSSIDLLEASLDDPRWSDTELRVHAFDSDFRSGPFSGDNLPATIDTKEVELNAARRTRLNAFRPLVNGGTVKARVGTRDRQTDNPTFGSAMSQSASGRFTTRSNARYHRFRLNITGDWTEALGVQVDRYEARRGERRG